MAELRYRAGKIRDPGVHKIGIIALGSHLENHGPALPIDTDAKIGAHIAFQSALETGAKFLGIIFPAYELDTIDHGVHVSLEVLKENVINTLNQAKKFLDIDLNDTFLDMTPKPQSIKEKKLICNCCLLFSQSHV